MAEFNLPKDAAPRFTLTPDQKRMGIEILNDNTALNRKPSVDRVAAALERIADSLERYMVRK